MDNFTNVILAKLIPAEPMFVAITTFDIRHRKSGRFLVLKKDLRELCEHDGKLIIDNDIGSYIRIIRNNKTVHFKITWLRHDFNNEVTGYIHEFDLPVEKVQAVLNLQAVHHVEYPNQNKEKAMLSFTDSGHQQLNYLRHDKLNRHALRRFFRDNLNYGRD